MNQIKPADYAEISNLLDDGSLHAIRWVPGGDGSGESARVEVVVSCLRGEESDNGEAVSGPLTLAFGGATALGFSFEPGRKPPSETSWPSAAESFALLAECERCNCVYFAHDNKEWFSDALSAPGLVWAHGDGGVFAAAPRTFIFVLEQGVRIDGYMHEAWILIAAAGVTAMDESGPLTIESWSDKYCTWWKGWKKHWDDEDASEGEGGSFSATIPPGEEEDHSGYTPPAEPLFELEPHDLPDELFAAVKTWVETEHAKRDDSTYCVFCPYVREVASWWMEGSRAQVNVLGMNHHRATDESPAFSRVAQFTLALARRSGAWVVSQPSWRTPDSDDVTQRPWVHAWQGGRIGYPVWYACSLYRLKRKLTRSGT